MVATDFTPDDKKELLAPLPRKEDAEPLIEKSMEAPFSFEYIENQLRKRHFGILSTISLQNRPHSVGVVYAVSPYTA